MASQYFIMHWKLVYKFIYEKYNYLESENSQTILNTMIKVV